nr:MAG TPA: Baseplate wedge protein [Caudoviricetes sp.]
MANWTSGILTNRGRDLQLKVEAGEKLKMTRFKLGDGMEATAEVADLNDLMGAKIAFGITGIERLGTLCKFTGVVTSTSVSAGFRAREWGLFAEDPDLGEILYMIALDDRPDYIAAQDAVLNSTITYALNVDISQASKIEPVIDPQGLVTTEILEKAAGLVKRNTGYSLNDKAFDIQLSAHPSWRLVCTKAGTTSGVLLNLHGAKLGDTYTDGTAEWTVKDAYEAAVDAHNKASDAHADIRRILDDKAPIESPALTGTPTAPTASAGTRSDQIATTNFVAAAITALVNSSPAALDTLQELAKAIGNDPNFATTILNKLSEKVSKSGDTMSGDLNLSKALNLTGGVTSAGFWAGQKDTGDPISAQDANLVIGSWFGIAFRDMCNNQVSCGIDARTGNYLTNGKVIAKGGIEGRLIGKADSAGHSDTSGRADNANMLGGQSLSDILGKINAQNTGGIVASSITQNGWVRFANGLIVQWGTIDGLSSVNKVYAFPIEFPTQAFTVMGASISYEYGVALRTFSRAQFTASWWPDEFGSTPQNGHLVQFIAIGH